MGKVPALGQGIRRIASVLRALGGSPVSGLRLTDVSAETHLNKATVHRLLAGLVEVGLVENDELTGHFHLSFEMFALGSGALNRYGLSELAREHLVRLENKSHDTVYLSVRSGFEAVCVDRHEGRYPIKALTLAVGDRRALGIGGGSLAILAFLPNQEVDKAMEANRQQLASYPNLDIPKIYGLIETSRRQGYAFFDGLVIPEMSAIGVPIMGPDGTPIAAIGVGAVKERMKSERRTVLVEWALEEAKLIEARFAKLAAGLTGQGLDSLTRAQVRQMETQGRSASGEASRADAKSAKKHRAKK